MSMLYPAMNQLTSYVPNRYMEEKPVTMAIDEVAEGKFDASTIDSSIQE